MEQALSQIQGYKDDAAHQQTQLAKATAGLEALQSRFDSMRDANGQMDDKMAAAEFRASALQQELKNAEKEILNLKN